MTIPTPARRAAAIVVGAIALAGCGSSSSTSSSSSASASTPASATRAAVGLGSSSLGPILVDGSGRTLYLFQADRGARSVCYGACAAAWPPLLTQGAPRAAGGVRAGLLGTTARRGGTRQVTYHDHPLYRFIDDSRAGQVNGEGSRAFGGEWVAVSAAGEAVAPGAHRAATSTSGGGYSGY